MFTAKHMCTFPRSFHTYNGIRNQSVVARNSLVSLDPPMKAYMHEWEKRNLPFRAPAQAECGFSHVRSCGRQHAGLAMCGLFLHTMPCF